MKTPALFLAALCSGTLLLGSCDNKPADTTTTETTTTETASTAADTAGEHSHMAGMDHDMMASSDAGGPMMGAMNAMMQKMHEAKPMGNTDHDFAHMMMDHHQGVVDMAAVLLRDGKDANLKAMAQKMSNDQKKEIQELEQIATRLDNAPKNYQPTNPNDPFQSKMAASMSGMMQNMPKASGSVDQDFAAMMVPHHQSAIDMAQAELAHGRDTRLKEMAQKMIDEQQNEIKQLQDWLAKNGTQK